MHANINANINNDIMWMFRLNHMPLAKVEEIIELNASKIQQLASILDYFPVTDRV